MTNLQKTFNRKQIILNLYNQIREEIAIYAFEYDRYSANIFVCNDLVEINYDGYFKVSSKSEHELGYLGESKFFLNHLEIIGNIFSKKDIELKNVTELLKTIL